LEVLNNDIENLELHIKIFKFQELATLNNLEVWLKFDNIHVSSSNQRYWSTQVESPEASPTEACRVQCHSLTHWAFFHQLFFFAVIGLRMDNSVAYSIGHCDTSC